TKTPASSPPLPTPPPQAGEGADRGCRYADNVTEAQLVAAAKAFAAYSGESYPLAARAPQNPGRNYFDIRQANSQELVIDEWTFGGGTAMMPQINHRESRDIDIFLPDPQLLPFLDPQK